MRKGLNKNYLNIRVKPMIETPQVDVVHIGKIMDNIDIIVGDTKFGHKLVKFDDDKMSFINDETNEVWNRFFNSVTDFTNGTAVVQDTAGIYHLATPTRYIFLSGNKLEIEDQKRNFSDLCYEKPDIFITHFFDKCELATSKELRNLAIEMIKIAVLTGRLLPKEADNLLKRVKSIIGRRSTKSQTERIMDRLTDFQNTDVEEFLKKSF